MMINSVCLPSADLGFGLGVPSPNRFLNFSFRPESLLVGLAMAGRNAPEAASTPRKQAEKSGEAPRTCPAADLRMPAREAESRVGTSLPQLLGGTQAQPSGPG